MGRIGKLLVLWFVMGMCYTQIELFARGVTYLPMTFIGGIAGVLIGLIDKHPAYSCLKMWQHCLLGMLIVLDVEFLSGYICNMRLHMNLWDYSGYPYNLDGQICARLAAAWFLLTPLAAWMDDYLRWKLFGEKKPKSVWNNYLRLFTLN